MGTEHNHSGIKTGHERPLLFALLLTSAFFVAEVVGGLITGSLALLSDAAHMLTDLTALTIALVAIKISRRPADTMRTFGYYRFEILAAAFNTTLLFLVAIYILYEAYQRFYHPPEIQSMGMLVIASIGLIVNLVSMRLLMSGKNKNLNMKSAYLEVWSDMLGSIGVIVAALIIRFTGWGWVDSIIAVLIGLWILPRTWVLLKESINILLEGVPAGIDLKKLLKLSLEIEGISDIHELHVWGITSDKISLTAHVVIKKEYDCEEVASNLRQMLISQFGISHTTLQHERIKCRGEEICTFT
jgi:cobalt-zinc-cadmium efflux system protein